MNSSGKPQRSFINRYWIAIVIVLWVIAWLSRDALAPSVETTSEEDTAVVAVAEDAATLAPTPAYPLDDGLDPMTGEPYEREDAAGAPPPIPDPQDLAHETDPALSDEPIARQVQAALEAGRAAYWDDGPEAAVRVLREALDRIPAASTQRADLYGELGNALYAAGDVQGAMQAWDSTLGLLPIRGQRIMVERLAPIYDHHHPDGASHLLDVISQ